ncbi:cysteine hydrolase family protein [Bosea sp. (in: a-proteobacteria)]|uniref:cysteine hydrolase family protein n=1 Tax=Bosea sp. (in: a-proteobacteria) TaxID=1871050 RepID=UPI00260F1959|nr:isochorismatase family cysteine hydrolase [Bosea sp. (in: a-proteobacteria)]MCO5090936.1 cysteine hydrolase [Bosea sp. (in: a-proteobacteria)]
MNEDNKTALLLLDLQNEMIHPDGKIGSGGLARIAQERGVLENAGRALKAARNRELPVAHIRLGFRPDYIDALSVAPRIDRLKASGAALVGSWGCEFPESLAPGQGELIVTKQGVNPFFNTGLLSWLHKNRISHLVFGGVATNLVVESTARAADDAGFAISVLEDCCASPKAEWHDFSIKNILPLFGKISSSAEFAS